MTASMKNFALCMREVGGVTDFDDGGKVLPNSGLYVRYLKFKAGDMVIGKEHKAWGADMLVYGTMILLNDPRGEKVTITGPAIFETAPNSQKIGKALTDCMFINVFKTLENEKEEAVLSRVSEEVDLCQLHG